MQHEERLPTPPTPPTLTVTKWISKLLLCGVECAILQSCMIGWSASNVKKHTADPCEQWTGLTWVGGCDSSTKTGQSTTRNATGEASADACQPTQQEEPSDPALTSCTSTESESKRPKSGSRNECTTPISKPAHRLAPMQEMNSIPRMKNCPSSSSSSLPQEKLQSVIQQCKQTELHNCGRSPKRQRSLQSGQQHKQQPSNQAIVQNDNGNYKNSMRCSKLEPIVQQQKLYRALKLRERVWESLCTAQQSKLRPLFRELQQLEVDRQVLW